MKLKKFNFLILFLLPFYLFSNSYEDGLQLEAQGDIKKALIKYNQYLDQEINNVPNDLLLERLLYISTLYESLDETTLFLINRAKQIKDKDLRSEIYFKIANIYELTGKIYNAGVYYEKSSYGKSGIDFTKLINSLYMLYEIGYFDKVIEKINSLKIKDESLNNDFKILKYLCLVKTKKTKDANSILASINTENLYIRTNKNYKPGSMYERIFTEFLELKNLSNYVDQKPVTLDLKNRYNNINETIIIGKFEELPGGVINILEQLEYNWQFNNNILSIKVYNRNKDKEILKKAGIDFEN